MNTLLDPLPGNLLLVVAPHAGGALMLELVARLACRGPLRLLEGGNRFDVYRCNQAVARALEELQAEASLRDRVAEGSAAELTLRQIMERIQLARAFTCYQLVSLLKQTPALPTPTLVLDMLTTFYDENVSADESLRLLGICLGELHRLNRSAPVAVSVRPGPPGSRPELLETLLGAAGQIWMLEPDLPAPPPSLF